MSLGRTFKVAWEGLTLNKVRSFLTTLGVIIGVAAVIALTALGEGARLYVVCQFASIGTNLLIVLPGKTETTGGMPGFGGVPNDLTIADAEAGVQHMRDLGVRYLMVRTDAAKAEAATSDELEFLAVSGTWDVYEVRDSAIVEAPLLEDGLHLTIQGAISAREGDRAAAERYLSGIPEFKAGIPTFAD